ncbi:MAG: phage tail protein [Ewingella sp.]|uniref:phage tail protein n=1 Tax=Ewingella TaxID=41201 RepID=UPI00336569DE
MTAKFFALLTNQGAAKLANATALGTQLSLTQMAVGDGGGVLPTPYPAQTKLIGEKRRASLNSLSVDPANTNQIIAEQIIPEDQGGFWIREIGLFDQDNTLIAIANCPETYKPQLQEGSGRTQTVRMIIVVSSTDAVTLKIDPSVVLATRKYVDDKVIEVKAYTDDQLAKHVAAANPHNQYLQISKSLAEIKTLGPDAVSAVLSNLGLKERGFEYSGVSGFGNKTSISASDFGSVIVIEANGQTIKLPTMNTLPAGKLITIYCFGGNGSPVVLQTQQGNYFSNGPEGNRTTTITLTTQETLTIVSEGSTSPNWEIYGNGTLKYSPLFGSSLFPNGYQRLPSGLIIQWGEAATSSNSLVSLPFPIPFPNNVYQATGSAVDVNNANIVMMKPSDRINFVVAAWATTNGGTLYRVQTPISWIAIGD